MTGGKLSGLLLALEQVLALIQVDDPCGSQQLCKLVLIQSAEQGMTLQFFW